MKFLTPFCLSLVVVEAMAASLAGTSDQYFRAPQQELFQTTAWLDPLNLSRDENTLASTINDSSGTPFLLQFFAPHGGSLSKILQAPSGYDIKRILLCSSEHRPLKGVSVLLRQDGDVGSVVTLSFTRMSDTAAGCAIYSVSGGVDGWGSPGKALDSSTYNKLEIILPPSKAPAELEAIGLRLQAALCHPDSNLPGFQQKHGLPAMDVQDSNHVTDVTPEKKEERCTAASAPPSAQDDVSDIYFPN